LKKMLFSSKAENSREGEVEKIYMVPGGRRTHIQVGGLPATLLGRYYYHWKKKNRVRIDLFYDRGQTVGSEKKEKKGRRRFHPKRAKRGEYRKG